MPDGGRGVEGAMRGRRHRGRTVGGGPTGIEWTPQRGGGRCVSVGFGSFVHCRVIAGKDPTRPTHSPPGRDKSDAKHEIEMQILVHDEARRTASAPHRICAGTGLTSRTSAPGPLDSGMEAPALAVGSAAPDMAMPVYRRSVRD